MTDNLLSVANSSPYFLTADDVDVLLLKGADATRFLQGQVTADVEALAIGACTPAAALTHKGRAYALFWLLKRDAETYVLVLNSGVGEVLTTQLRKYLPFYKCQFTKELDGEFLLTVGAELREGEHLACVLGEAPHTVAYWLPTGSDLSGLTAGLTRGDARRWLTDAVLLGHFPFTPADAELYTAAELNLDAHGYVSYEKGCYTGQEIVARMHYRGKVKKQLYRLELADLVDADNLTLRDADGNDIGSVLKALALGAAQWRALAFLPTEAVDGERRPVPSAGRLVDCAPL